jgi:transposase-like protein
MPAKKDKPDPRQLFRMTEDEAREFLERVRWPKGPICPHCGSDKVTALQGKSTRPGVKKCRTCRKQFTVTVGTIFHRSHIPLRDWVYAFARICASKKGVSALQLQRELGLTYKSAWFMAHRIRYAMRQEPLAGMLRGVVEVDEAYIGGKVRKHVDREKRRQARLAGRRIPLHTMSTVVTLVERDGRAVSRVVTDVTKETLHGAIRDLVDEGSTINTDELRGYIGVGTHFEGGHKRVNHSKGEYYRHEDDAGTNTVECYFSLLKRGVYGAFHNVSKQHLPRYLDEFDFRWNHRKVTDMERTVAAIEGAEGKRLSYRSPTGRPVN